MKESMEEEYYNRKCKEKTLNNSTASQTKDNVKDIAFWGDGDTFKLISKTSSKQEGWMKSTKAMEIKGVGCLVQVSTQQGGHVAEALQFIPNVCIIEKWDKHNEVIAREIVSMYDAHETGDNKYDRFI